MDAMKDYANNPPAHSPGQSADWHPADVLAALKKRGQSLAGLSVANGYHPTAAGKALKQPWPAMELLLANALGLTPQTIWPSRYDPEGRPLPRART
jgi:Ner family transcriptional regulator